MMNYDTLVSCPKCLGTGQIPEGIAFHNTGEDVTKHYCTRTGGKCGECNGSGTISLGRFEQIALAEGRRRTRVLFGISLHKGAELLGINAAELSALEHARSFGPTQLGKS